MCKFRNSSMRERKHGNSASSRFAILARSAGEKIANEIDESNKQLELGAEPKPYPDLGFRVLRIDSSNFKDFYLTPGETSQESLFDFADNVKEGRSELDLLFEVLPKLGIPYSAKIEERVLAGKKVFFVDGDKLAACFDANVCLLRRFCYAVPRAAATPFRGWLIRANAATVRPTRGARAPLLA